MYISWQNKRILLATGSIQMKKGLKIFGWAVIIYIITQLLAIIPFRILEYFSSSDSRFIEVFGFPFPVKASVYDGGECGTPHGWFIPEFLIVNFIIITIVTFLIYFILHLIKNNFKLKTKMINIVLFGKPGAGKGTQAEFLKEKYNLVHLSTGDIFRFNMKNDTDLGKLAKSYIEKGDLVPDEVTIKMLQDEVEKNPGAKGFLFDGFPRTIPQADALDAFLKSKSWEVTATVALEADDDILVQRILERGKTSGRVDDQDEEKIRNRYQEYNEKTLPLMDYYKQQNKFYAVDGIGTVAEVTERLSAVIDKL